MADYLLKGIPTDQYEQLQRIAGSRGSNVAEMLRGFIASVVGDRDDMILAYVPISEIGDMNLEDDCPQCDQPFSKVARVRIGIRANGLDPILICSGCAWEHSGHENG